MSDTIAATPAPKTPMSKKKLYAIIASVIVLLLGVNHFTVQLGYGTEATVTGTDSTLSVIVKAVPTAAPVDTAKKDTTKK